MSPWKFHSISVSTFNRKNIKQVVIVIDQVWKRARILIGQFISLKACLELPFACTIEISYINCSTAPPYLNTLFVRLFGLKWNHVCNVVCKIIMCLYFQMVCLTDEYDLLSRFELTTFLLLSKHCIWLLHHLSLRKKVFET